MSPQPKTVLQIVPHQLGTFDGIGDYGLNLARELSAHYGITTTFLVAGPTSMASREGYTVISGLAGVAPDELAQRFNHVILHYVNYGYQSRGVPFSLNAFVKKLRSLLRGHWITMFHELYASGPPWKSAFWLRPLQVRIARDMIDVSTACVVSNTPIEEAIHAYDPRKKVFVAPVMSNFGEPELASFEAASPKHWAICGGTALIRRSVTLFEQLHERIPDAFAPERLDVIGGHADSSVRTALDRLSQSRPGLSCRYHPEVAAELASEMLREAACGWIDYFGAGKMWPGMLLKSTAFAAFCAHGTIPILSHREKPIAVRGDPLPGPYYITPEAINFPEPERLRETQQQIYAWYQTHAHSKQLACVYAEALS